jgi:CrcB protein
VYAKKRRRRGFPLESLIQPYLPFLIIGIGGFLGANLRYLVANGVAARYGTALPYGTFLINVSGSLVIGFFLTIVTERVVAPPALRLFFATGFLGAYTTFSTFTYESLTLILAGNVLAGAANLATSVGLGMVAVTVGVILGRLL